MGIAQSVLLVTSLAITADLIGKNTESGAFVYGCVSFLDKLSNGIVCQTVQYLNENAKCVEPPEAHCRHFYRDVMVYVPGGTVTLAVIVMITVLPQKIGQRQEEVEKISRSRYTVPRDDEIVVS